MSNATESRKRVKPGRTCRLFQVDGALALCIQDRGKSTYYHLAELAVDWGRGFELRKFCQSGSEVYHVHLDQEQGDTCDCLGHLRWSHKGTVCRHVGAVQALIAAGKL